MASFGWKKKAPKLNSSVSYTPSKSQGTVNVFGDDIEENEDKIDSGKGEKGCEHNVHYDWCVDLKNRKRNQASETISQQINRFKKEGIQLAENQEYWQAIGRWDMALHSIQMNLSSAEESAKFLHEMKSQAFIQLHEWEPAIEAAEKAINVDPMWYPAYQTLGRSHLGVGNVLRAVKSFSKARHINPEDQELKVQDLEWASSLLTHQKLMAAAREINETKCST